MRVLARRAASIAMCAVVLAASPACSGSRPGRSAASTTEANGPRDLGSTYCAELGRFLPLTEVTGDTRSADELRALVEDFKATRASLVAGAPAVIAADVTVFVEGVDKVGQALAKMDFDRGKLAPLSNPAATDAVLHAAADRLTVFVKAGCKAGAGDPPSPSPPTTDR